MSLRQRDQDEHLWTLIRRSIRSYRPDRWTIPASSLALVLSVGAAIAPGDNLLNMLGYETYADLTDDDVSTKPSDWTGREETAEVESAKGADLEDRDLRHADASGAFLVKAKLGGEDLSGADLRGTDLRGPNFFSANLRGANLANVDLSGAKLMVANLSYARHLTQTQLEGACGDDKTQLPQGLTIRMCPVRAAQP
jgi:Pentapeptide repeats (8 copies)